MHRPIPVLCSTLTQRQIHAEQELAYIISSATIILGVGWTTYHVPAVVG